MLIILFGICVLLFENEIVIMNNIFFFWKFIVYVGFLLLGIVYIL